MIKIVHSLKRDLLCSVVFLILIIGCNNPVLAEYQFITTDIEKKSFFYIDTSNIVCIPNGYSNVWSVCKAYQQVKKSTGRKDQQGFEIYYINEHSLWAFDCINHAFVIISMTTYDEQGKVIKSYNNPIPDQALMFSKNKEFIMPGTLMAILENASCTRIKNYKPLLDH